MASEATATLRTRSGKRNSHVECCRDTHNPKKNIKGLWDVYCYEINMLYLQKEKRIAMDSSSDIRWVQRLDNYERAVRRLEGAVALLLDQSGFGIEVDELLKEGLVQRYEYTQELAWKLMKDYEEFQGYTDIQGSRDAIRKALAMGLVSDGAWMETIASRNITSHCYDEAEFNAIFSKIVTTYVPLFLEFCETMKNKKNEQ